MTENEKFSGVSASGVIVVCLYVAAGISVATGVLVGIALVIQTPEEGRSALAIWAQGAEGLLQSVVMACLLWAAAWLIRRREDTTVSHRRMMRVLSDLRRQNGVSSDDSALAGQDHGKGQTRDGPLLDRVLEELAELNANVLLTEEERREKREFRLAEQADQLSRQVELAVLDRNYGEAETTLERLERIDSEHARIAPLREQIQAGQEEQTQEWIQGEVRRASDLMSVSRFEEAFSLAEELHQHYPHSHEADQLLSRVQREASTYRTEQRRRLYAIIQEHSQARHWKQALTGAHKLIETYPDSEEARKIRTRMPTLVDNARIQEVREHRDRMLDLMERRRYAEAVDLARQVVENYPETTAAEELRAQLPRLQELAFANKTNGE